MREFLSRIDLNSPDAFNQVVEFTYGLDSYFGDAAAAVGTEKFEEFTGEKGDILGAMKSRIEEGRIKGSIADAMRRVQKNNQFHTAEAFAKQLDGRIDRFIRERATRAMVGSAKAANERNRASAKLNAPGGRRKKRKSGTRKDPDPGVYWAYVPEPGACAFCIMQGSRGWMDTSSNPEGKIKFHDNCRCKVVASKDKHVEGYDPKALKEQYEQAKSKAESSAD